MNNTLLQSLTIFKDVASMRSLKIPLIYFPAKNSSQFSYNNRKDQKT